MQAFLFYIDDWLSSKKIEMMDASEERGYLRLLLRAAKEDDCGLPDDDDQLAIMSLLGPQWGKPTADKMRRVGQKTSGQKVRECFISKDGRLYNERLLKEFENQKRVRAARAEAGGKGGRPRKQMESNSFSIGIANGKQTETNHSLGLGFSSFQKKIDEPKNGDWPNARDFTEAWGRHLKQRKDQPMQVVVQMLIGRGSTVDWNKLREKHPKYCAFWDEKGWSYCPLTLLEWIDGGMLPAASENGSRNGRVHDPSDTEYRD